MKKTKLEKGITLVALIITIVVLLILAVVSIGAVKNSGIINHSQNAADTWTTAKTTENASLLKYENYLDKYENKIYGKEKEWKVYKGDDKYAIISSDGDYLLRTSKNTSGWTINTKFETKMSLEEYIKYTIDMSDTKPTADEIAQIRDAMNSMNVQYVMINEKDNAFVAYCGDRISIGEGFLELDVELAKNVIKKKGTFECYGIGEGCYIVDKKNNIIDFGVEIQGQCALLTTANINNETLIEEQFDIPLKNEQTLTIEKGARKLGVYFVEDADQGTYKENEEYIYIQGDTLYIGKAFSGVENNEVNSWQKNEEIDLAKFGILVIE